MSDKRKIPVTDRQFLWVQDDDKGEVVLHVGPTMVSPTAADRIVVDDGQGGFADSASARPQRMIELSDAQYAVLFNPLSDRQGDEGPNGRFRPGRNEARPLMNGTRHMIPGPCSFYLRPGQRVEVRDAHELASNQYLVVKVYGEVDEGAPYYDITSRSAAITTATSEDATGGESTQILSEVEPVALSRGQLIVIRGLDTQFYIPPTGVDVVPDLSMDAKGTRLTAEAARKILASVPQPAPVPASFAVGGVEAAAIEDNVFGDDMLDALDVEEDDDEYYEERGQRRGSQQRRLRRADKAKPQKKIPAPRQSARLLQEQRPTAPPPPPPREEAPKLSKGEVQQLLGNPVYRQALEREMRKARLVRQAVVLGEKEFCVILDADGKRQIKVGPARVFPGPYDSFMTEGSDNRIYYAYEMLPQRALWLRFIAPIAKERLAQKLPRSVELEKDVYQPGDEMLMTGVNSFFFPFNEIEILHPLTGQTHVGNDHSDVFIEAIGIDQKSGIYVRDLATGEARLVRGKRSYLVDPRKEVHIMRRVPPGDWNLWIGSGEPHKTATTTVETPWAISITVPHNTAVLAASAEGQRVIEGPRVALLEYDEKLVPLELSTGTPKTDNQLLKTCYLRTTGNRVSDMIHVETADFVKVSIRLTYQVHFEAGDRDKWFNHENYVGLLCDHLRSIVRGRCRQLSLTDLWPRLVMVIRDIILGERTEEGRKGRRFDVNGMFVNEVEVLESEILDEEIAELFEHVQRESVAMVIGDRQVSEKLRSEQLRHGIEQERHRLQRETHERQAELEALMRRLQHTASEEQARNNEALSRLRAELEAQRQLASLQSEIERTRLAYEAKLQQIDREILTKVQHLRLQHEEEQTHQRALVALEIEQLQAESRALVAEREAVQPALVEALTALGDKQILSEVAQNMNLVSLFKGKDVGTLFQEILGGTRLGDTIQAMLPDSEGD